jgi:hypothetical protein
MPRGTSFHALLPSRLPTEVQRAGYVTGMVRGDARIERVDGEVRLGHHGVDHPGAHHPLNDPASGPCRSSACECWLKRAAVCLGRRAGVAESTPQSTQRCRATLLPQAWFAYSARCLARAVDAAVYRRTRPVRRTQALCLARSPPYDVCSRSDDLAGARIPPRPQQPSASTARARGSRTSWQVPRPTTENAKNRSYSTF